MIKKQRLGDLLLTKKMVTPKDLELALTYSNNKNVRLGEALIALGLISDVKLLTVLAEQSNLPIKTENINVNKAVFDIVPKNLMREYKFFPFDFDNTSISILIYDTVNLVVMDDVEQLLGRKLRTYLVREVEFERLVDKYLNHSKIIEDLKELDYTETTIRSFDVSVDTESSPVSKAVNSYLKQGYLSLASDIHFDITDKEMLVRYRIDGELMIAHRVPKSSASFIVARLKLMANLNTTETRIPQDGAIQIAVNKKVIDLRVSVVPALYGEKVVIRILDKKNSIKEVDNVGFSDDNLKKIKRMVAHPFGMILVTGPTSSGKSTLLYTFVHHVMSETKNIITIEDPVEYKLPQVTQITVNEASGLTFPVGLRAILRQDPDIVLVGEMRDDLTAEIGIKASNTGHLVLSTLHTNSAVSSVTRLTEMGVEPYLVVGALIGVVNQRLVRKLCPDCKKQYTSKETNEDREFFNLDPDKEYILYEGVGCTTCNHTGYSGRIPIHEVLLLDDELKHLISERRSLKEIERAAIANGMITLKADGLSKALEGITSLKELRKHVV